MLLPRYFKFIGFFLVIPSLVIGVLFEFADYVIPFLNYHGGRRRGAMAAIGDHNMTDEIATTLLIFGLFFIGLSKLKNENDQTLKLRLSALFWAVLVEGVSESALLIVFNSGLFQIDFIQQYDTPVLVFINNNNLVILFITYLLRFYYLYYCNKQSPKPYYISFRPLVLAAKAITIILLTYILGASLDLIKIKALDYAIFILLPAILIWVGSGDQTKGELIEPIRLKAMLISVGFNYSLFIVLTWAVYGINYLAVQYISMASVPLLFIPLFYWLKSRQKSQPGVTVSLS
ncbi:hypothetical protein HYN43_025290 [Mucilaginibacter celer]|uniref:Uncharacterized protein n=2 Tax=Mucilaginibacter celer TaxID=2305508 RepID=A0A494W4G8_9SPHI|nr:hypothetical protein HYN43_025290 [Mucilaginibacter celer]